MLTCSVFSVGLTRIELTELGCSGVHGLGCNVSGLRKAQGVLADYHSKFHHNLNRRKGPRAEEPNSGQHGIRRVPRRAYVP